MAVDPEFADRIRQVFSRRAITFEEKRMMGGLCFMVAGKMCLGINDDRLMVRLDPAIYEESLLKPGCVPMDFTGRPMRGFVFIRPEGTSSSVSLGYWVDLALEFNPRAKAARPSQPRKSSTRQGQTPQTPPAKRKSRS